MLPTEYSNLFNVLKKPKKWTKNSLSQNNWHHLIWFVFTGLVFTEIVMSSPKHYFLWSKTSHEIAYLPFFSALFTTMMTLQWFKIATISDFSSIHRSLGLVIKGDFSQRPKFNIISVNNWSQTPNCHCRHVSGIPLYSKGAKRLMRTSSERAETLHASTNWRNSNVKHQFLYFLELFWNWLESVFFSKKNYLWATKTNTDSKPASLSRIMTDQTPCFSRKLLNSQAL